MNFLYCRFKAHACKALRAKESTRLFILGKYSRYNSGNCAFGGIRCVRAAEVGSAPARVGEVNHDVRTFDR